MSEYKFICRSCGSSFSVEREELMLMNEMREICESTCENCEETGVIEFDSPFGGNFSLGYQGSSVQSGPKVRRFQEEVLKPIKRGLGRTGRVKGIE